MMHEKTYLENQELFEKVNHFRHFWVDESLVSTVHWLAFSVVRSPSRKQGFPSSYVKLCLSRIMMFEQPSFELKVCQDGGLCL